MKTRLLLNLLGVLAAGAIGLSGTAVAQGQGGGNGGGGGGGGEDAAPDFGDLIILLRDENGVPIPSESVLVPDPESGQLVDGGLCWQPIAFNVGDDVLCPAACVVDSYPSGTDVVSVDQRTCAVAAGCSGCTHEVEFGRINEARSPASVFEAQLEDVIIKLATADSTSLDPAGRMVASSCVEVDEKIVITSTSTIDSPLQNLAVYRELMLKGTIGVDLPQGADIFDTAARGLGVASDKGGSVNKDMVAYLNMLMGLDDVPTFIGKLCETYREEVQGTIQLVEKCFLNYGSDLSDVASVPGGLDGANYSYTRSGNFSILGPSLPLPSYIPKSGPHDGWFEYLVTTDPVTPSFTIAQGPILDGVFCVDGDGLPVLPTPAGICPAFIDPGFEGGNIGGFAQAADDTRAVINFMHDWPMPDADVFGTAVPCVPSGDILYDLAISEQSGLQVPKNYVNGGEREFFINVGNLGPDVANGTVTVVANDDEGLIESWPFTIDELGPGQTASFTQLFTINTTSRQIYWSATVVADPPGTDPNPSNNTVSATSVVRASGGGGGH